MRRNLYEIENKKNLSKSKIKEIEQNLTELEESLFKLNKYDDYDDIKYKEIRDVPNLFNRIAFNQLIDEDYYRPIRTASVFNGDYIKYKKKEDKDKKWSPKEYLDMIKPYLSEIIKDHKTPKDLRVHSSNEVIYHETQFGEWKIQLTMQINFISSKYSGETRTMHTKSENIEIMMGKTNDIIEGISESILQNYQERLEESIKESEFVRDSIDLFYYHLQK